MSFFSIKILKNNSFLKGAKMKVAFATKDLNMIDEHFGWAKQFAIYEVNKDGGEFVEVIKTAEDIEEEDSKIKSKTDALVGVSIVYCQAIGPTAAAKVVQSRIHPMKVNEPILITDAIDSLVKMLNGNPPPWIKRIIAKEGMENNG
jgi:nitrogen fixation protein NifX